MVIQNEKDTDFKLFLQESQGLMTRFQEISQLLKGPVVESVFQELHRVFHSWKGLTKTLGIRLLPELFDQLAVLSANLVDPRLEDQDEIRTFLASGVSWLPDLIPSSFDVPINDSKIQQHLIQVRALLIKTQGKNPIQDLLKERKLFTDLGIENKQFSARSVSGDFFYSITIIIEETTLKKTRIYTLLRNLKLRDNSIQFIRIVPILDEILNNRFDLTFQIDIHSQMSSEALNDFFEHSLNIKDFRIVLKTRDMIFASGSSPTGNRGE